MVIRTGKMRYICRLSYKIIQEKNKFGNDIVNIFSRLSYKLEKYDAATETKGITESSVHLNNISMFITERNGLEMVC